MSPIEWILLLQGVVTLVSSIYQTSHQESMLESQQDFNSAEAEKARDWSVNGKYDDFVGLGFNPDLAAASVMGNAQSVPYAASSPNAPQVPSVLGGFEKLMEQMPSFINDEKKVNSEIQHTDLLNEELRIRNGILPITLQSQIDYYSAYANELAADADIKKENLKLVQAQTPYAQALAAEQYFQAVALTDRMFLDCDKILSEVASNYADVDLKKAMKSWYHADTWRVKSEELKNYAQAWESEEGARLNIEKQGLVKAQALTEEQNAISAGLKAIQDYMDTELRQRSGNLPIQSDIMTQLAIMHYFGDADAIKVRDGILAGERTIYDNYILSRYENYDKEFIMNFGNAIPEIIRGFIPISHTTVGNKPMPTTKPTSTQKPITPGSTMEGKWNITYPSTGKTHTIYTNKNGRIYATE